jgi:GNAT superfamily N-acetyltransferase
MLLFRRLFVLDEDAFRAHLKRLSPEDRRFRFAGPASNEFLDGYVDQLDWSETILIGCEVDGVLRGAAELKPISRAWPPSAEVAFTIEGPFQCHGIGTRLFRRIATLATNRGYRQLYTLCLAANRRMRRIAVGYQARLVTYEDEVEGLVDLPWPTPFSVAEEVLDSGIASVAHAARAADQVDAACASAVENPCAA